MIAAVYINLESLRWWMTDPAHVVEGRLAVGDQVRQADADKVRVYVRLTAARWNWLRRNYAAPVLADIREALATCYGADRLAIAEAA